MRWHSVENNELLGEKLSLPEEFGRRDVRVAGLIRSINNRFSDSATGEQRCQSRSILGVRWFHDASGLGLAIGKALRFPHTDGAHVADGRQKLGRERSVCFWVCRPQKRTCR